MHHNVTTTKAGIPRYYDLSLQDLDAPETRWTAKFLLDMKVVKDQDG